MSEERFDRIDQRFADVDARFDGVDRRFDGIDARLDGIDQRIGVLHEDLIGRIAAVSERKAVTEDQFAAGIADLKDSIGRRLDPLELAVRTHTEELKQHAADIAELKRAR